MEYPFCTQQKIRGCVHFQENDIHHQILEELEGSIRVRAEGSTMDRRGSIREVRVFLSAHFGYGISEYPYWRCSDRTFRIKLPHALSRAIVVEEGNIWGSQNGWSMMEWDTMWDARRQEKHFRVRVKITNLPEEFCHPFFIQQVAAQFGDIQKTDEENIQSPNHRNLCLWVSCSDPRRIPYSSVIPYGNNWKKCFIQVISWEYTGDLPSDLDLTPPEDSGERYGSNSGDTEFFVRRSMIQFHDSINAFNRAQPSSPEPSSASNPMDCNEPMPQPSMNRAQRPNNSKENINQVHGKSKVAVQKIIRDFGGKGHKWNPLTQVQEKVALQVGRYTIVLKDEGGTVVSTKPGVKTTNQLCKQGEKSFLATFNVKVGQVLILHLSQTYTEMGKGEVESSKGASAYNIEGKTPIRIGTICIFGSSDVEDSYCLKAVKKRERCSKEIGLTNKPKIQAVINPLYEPNLFSQPPKKLYSPNIVPEGAKHTSHKKLNLATSEVTASRMDLSDEQFLAQFTALSSDEGSSQTFHLPQSGVATREWGLCLLVRIITDKTIIDHQFTGTMMKAWGIDPATDISILTRNVFLAQFTNRDDLERVLQRGIWTYRSDSVILKRVQGQTDLEEPKVEEAEVWTQWHKIPPAAVSPTGLSMLAQRIGTPLSDVTEIFAGGQKFYKIKMLIKVDKPLQDHLDVHNPTLGNFTTYIIYEKLPRIYLFCGRIGHDQLGCVEKVRFERLKQDPRYKDRLEQQPQSKNKTRIGPWINNQALVPLANNPTRPPVRGNGPETNGGSDFTGPDPDGLQPVSRNRRMISLKRMNSLSLGEQKQSEGGVITISDIELSAQTSGAALENYANKKRILEGSSAQPPECQ